MNVELRSRPQEAFHPGRPTPPSAPSRTPEIVTLTPAITTQWNAEIKAGKRPAYVYSGMSYEELTQFMTWAYDLVRYTQQLEALVDHYRGDLAKAGKEKPLRPPPEQARDPPAKKPGAGFETQ